MCHELRLLVPFWSALLLSMVTTAVWGQTSDVETKRRQMLEWSLNYSFKTLSRELQQARRIDADGRELNFLVAATRNLMVEVEQVRSHVGQGADYGAELSELEGFEQRLDDQVRLRTAEESRSGGVDVAALSEEFKEMRRRIASNLFAPTEPLHPDADIVLLKANALSRSLTRLNEGISQLEPFAVPLTWSGPFDANYKTNMSLLRGRSAALCKLLTAFDDALRDGRANAQQVELYETWLKAELIGESPALTESITDLPELRREVRNLIARWKVLAHLHGQRLLRRAADAPADERAQLTREAGRLGELVGNYLFVEDRASHEREFTTQLTVFEQEQEMERLMTELRLKRAKYEELQARGAQTYRGDEASVLPQRDLQALRRCRELRDVAAALAEQADAVAANAEHLQQLLTALNRVNSTLNKGKVMREFLRADAHAVDRLAMVTGSQRPASATKSADLKTLLAPLK